MPRDAPRQFPLDLPVEPRFGLEDFLVAPANAAAHALVTGWPLWPDRVLLLAGPEGSGKSHLGAIWSSASGAHSASDPDDALAAALVAARPLIFIDDCDRAAADETALFHLLNAVREREGHLLLAARSTPTLLWPKLPDLASRLRAAPVARLDPPDESIVTAVLIKLLDDRQLRVEAGVVEFLARRADRSLGAVRALVEALDRESLARGRAVGRGLAADVLARLQEEGDDRWT
jgi:chromosomal replication initiation ATPase DnaA